MAGVVAVVSPPTTLAPATSQEGRCGHCTGAERWRGPPTAADAVEQLVGPSRQLPIRVTLLTVGVLAVLGAVTLISGGSGDGTRTGRPGTTTAPQMATGAPPTAAGDAAPGVPATPLLVPAAPCGQVAELRLHGWLVLLHAAAQQPDPLSDLSLTECGSADGVVITPDADALLSQADVSAAASYTECAESMREGTVSRLVVGVGATFCALQRAGTVARFGGQTMARVTVTGIDAGGAVVLDLEAWPV